MLLPLLAGHAASPLSELAIGRSYYEQGEFKRAMAHFRRALATNPDSAEVNYWTGMSYQGLSDVAAPFGGGYDSKALLYLTRASGLAPGRAEYRRALFDFLSDSAASSPRHLRLAREMLSNTPVSDPEYGYMRRRLERESSSSSSAEARFDRLFLAIPRIAVSVAAPR